MRHHDDPPGPAGGGRGGPRPFVAGIRRFWARQPRAARDAFWGWIRNISAP